MAASTIATAAASRVVVAAATATLLATAASAATAAALLEATVATIAALVGAVGTATARAATLLGAVIAKITPSGAAAVRKQDGVALLLAPGLEIFLLEVQAGEGHIKGWERHEVTEDSVDGLKVLMEALEHLDGEVFVRYAHADVRQCIGDHLELTSIVNNGHVTLAEVVVLAGEVDALGSVVGEKVSRMRVHVARAVPSSEMTTSARQPTMVE